MADANKIIDPREELLGLVSEYEDTLEGQQKQFSPITDQFQDDGYGVWSQETRAWMDLMTLKGLYFNEDWVFILIDRIASKIAAQSLRVMRSQKYVRGELIEEPDEEHPLNALLETPNEFQPYSEWMYSIVADRCISGNAIIWGAPETGQLIHLPIEMTQLDFTRDVKNPVYRIVQYNTEYDIPVPHNVMAIPANQIAHTRRPNPSSARWGLSPFIPGRKSVLFNRYSMEFLNNFYIKGAQPGMVLEIGEGANEKNALRLLRSMEAAYTGRKNQRRNMILPKGVKAGSWAHTLADQQLKDYVGLNRETIINLLQVPKHELSIAESGSLGSEEYKTALRNFWAGPLRSTMQSIAESLTVLLRPQLGKDRWLSFDVSDVEILQEDLSAKADLAEKMLKTHTLNEVRAKVFNEDPLPGGDALPVGLQPQQPQGGMFSLMPAQQTVAALAPAPAVNVDETAKIEDITSDSNPDERRKVLDANLEILGRLKTENSDWWAKREAQSSRAEKTIASVHDLILGIFADQADKVLGLVKSDLRGQGFKAFHKKEEFRKSKVRRLIRDALESFEERWLDNSVKILESTVETGYSTQLILPFNIPNQSEIEALRSRNASKRNDILEARGIDTFAHMSRTTTDKIMAIITEGVESSRSVQEIADNIAQNFTNIDNIHKRAMTIARTETLTAASIGQAAAMHDAAKVIPKLKKMWINAGDVRVRGNPGGEYPDASKDHWSIGGEIVGWDKQFSNKLSYPRDTSGTADNVINCRCTFIMIPGDNADALGIQDLQSEFQDLQSNS